MPRLNTEDIRTVLQPILEYYPQRDRGIISEIWGSSHICHLVLSQQYCSNAGHHCRTAHQLQKAASNIAEIVPIQTTVSTLLEQSNIENDTPFTFVRYRMERLQVHGRERTGCSSKNFLRLPFLLIPF